MTRDEAVEIVRAWSLRHGTTVDDVADQLLTGQLDVPDLLP